MKPERCQAIAKNGKPCGAASLPGDTLCAWHSPRWEEKRREWSRKGGAARSNARRATKQMPAALTSGDLLVTLSRAIRNVETGLLEPGPANAMAVLARTMSSIREATEVEARLSALEDAASRSGIA